MGKVEWDPKVGILEVVPSGYYVPSREDVSSEGGSGDESDEVDEEAAAKAHRARRMSMDVNYSEELRHIVKVLERKKKEAVRGERFEEAKDIKHAVNKIKKAEEDVPQPSTWPSMDSISFAAGQTPAGQAGGRRG